MTLFDAKLMTKMMVTMTFWGILFPNVDNDDVQTLGEFSNEKYNRRIMIDNHAFP